MLEAAGAALDDVRGDRVDPLDDPPQEPSPDVPRDLPARLRAELSDPSRTDGALHRLLRDLGWTPPPRPRPPLRPPEVDGLLGLLAAGSSVHEAADRLGVPVESLREELRTLRRDHACSSTAEVVRRTWAGH